MNGPLSLIHQSGVGSLHFSSLPCDVLADKAPWIWVIPTEGSREDLGSEQLKELTRHYHLSFILEESE